MVEGLERQDVSDRNLAMTCIKPSRPKCLEFFYTCRNFAEHEDRLMIIHSENGNELERTEEY